MELNTCHLGGVFCTHHQQQNSAKLHLKLKRVRNALTLRERGVGYVGTTHLHSEKYGVPIVRITSFSLRYCGYKIMTSTVYLELHLPNNIFFHECLFTL